MKKYKRIMFCIFAISVLIGLSGHQDQVFAAEGVMVQIMEGTLGHAINRTMKSHEERDGWKIRLNKGRKVESATWISSDKDVMSVKGDNEGATVKTYKEGVAVLSLIVKTDKGEIVSDQCLISSVCVLDSYRQATGKVKDVANLYRGASTSSKIRNRVIAGQKLTVIALCKDFYRVRLPESYDFNDSLNQDTAYVLKSKIDISAVSVEFKNDNQFSSLKVGEKVKILYSVFPDIVTSKKMIYMSSDEKVAYVDKNGIVTGRKAGVATITLIEENSGKKVSTTITVHDILVTALTITNEEELKEIPVGRTITAKTEMAPGNATKKKLIWKSDNAKVVAVDDNGVIKALADGKATITATEIYSGVIASININSRYYMELPKVVSENKIKLKKNTDLRGIYISWNKISNAKYYKIYVERWDMDHKKFVSTFKTGKKVKTAYYHDTKIIRNSKYRYCVVAYDSRNRPLTAKKKRAKKITVKATVPDLTVTPGQLGKMKLNWNKDSANKRKGIEGYKIYRSKKRNGKYVKVKQIKKKSTLEWTDTKLQEGKTFYYRIRAYGKYKKKKIQGALSDRESAVTISSQKNWNYFNNIKDKWKGICLEPRTITEQQSVDRMKTYSIEANGKIIYPYIKYHLTTDTLYIHVYVKFFTFDRATGKEIKVSEKKGVYQNDPEKKGRSYKSEFIKGVTSAFKTFIKGNENDFSRGVSFHTKLILHDKDMGNYHKEQEFLGVSIGGDCDCEDCMKKELNSKESSNYWFHAYSCLDGCVVSSRNRLHIPDNEHLISGQEEQPMETVENFRAGCAHEMGHILGLGDGYVALDKDEKRVVRMTYNTETCFWSDDIWFNLMIQPRDYCVIRPNDMEMILQAYGLSLQLWGKGKAVDQYYKTHYWYGALCNISQVIIKKGDENAK